MIEFFTEIILFLTQLHFFTLSISMTKSDFDCIEIPRSPLIERDSSPSSWTGINPPQDEFLFGNISLQRFHAPCFNATFPTTLTAEEGSDVILPCVVHNVDFSSTVVGILSFPLH